MYAVQNVKKDLLNLRKICPGLKEEVYVITDYMAHLMSDQSIPAAAVVNLLFSIVDDVQKEKCQFVGAKTPEKLLQNPSGILKTVSDFPMIIEMIADTEKFANEFKKSFQEQMLKYVNDENL